MTESQKELVRGLAGDQQKALISLGEKLVSEWVSVSSKKDTEFDTIWQIAYMEGKRHGVQDFLQRIDNPS